jgi:hypothetical protein
MVAGVDCHVRVEYESRRLVGASVRLDIPVCTCSLEYGCLVAPAWTGRLVCTVHCATVCQAMGRPLKPVPIRRLPPAVHNFDRCRVSFYVALTRTTFQARVYARLSRQPAVMRFG